MSPAPWVIVLAFGGFAMLLAWLEAESEVDWDAPDMQRWNRLRRWLRW